jgi:transcriptional regulator with XRE-family HTH domain
MNMVDRIKQRMQDLDINQDGLAAATGLTQPAIYKLLAGITKRTTRLPELISALKTTKDWLVDGIGPKEASANPQNQEFYRAFESIPAEEQEAIRVLVLHRFQAEAQAIAQAQAQTQAMTQAMAQEMAQSVGQEPPRLHRQRAPKPPRLHRQRAPKPPRLLQSDPA